MRVRTKLAAAAVAVPIVIGTTVAAVGATGTQRKVVGARAPVHVRLTPSTPQLAACMRHARVSVTVNLTTEKTGFDVFNISASGLPHKRDFTVFLLERPGPPFGAAEYIGDLTSDRRGNGNATYHLIAQEAFSSTLVNGQRVRVDLNWIGAWFADPKGDDFCLGSNSPVTPFDGDNRAGVQAFNSLHSRALPAP